MLDLADGGAAVAVNYKRLSRGTIYNHHPKPETPKNAKLYPEGATRFRRKLSRPEGMPGSNRP